MDQIPLAIGGSDSLVGTQLAAHAGFALATFTIADLFGFTFNSVRLYDLTAAQPVPITIDPGYTDFKQEEAWNFGSSVDLDGTYLVGGTSGVLGSGMAQVIDQATGDALRTLVSGLEPNGAYASRVAISEGIVVIGDWTSSLNAQFAGACEVFDASTGAWLGELASPSPAAGALFGRSVAMQGDRAAVGAPGDETVHVYDVPTRTLLFSVSEPDAGADRDFGREVDVDGSTLVVGTRGEPGAPGTAFAYDLATGAFLDEFAQAPPGDVLGTYHVDVAVLGDAVATSASDVDVPTAHDDGAVFVNDLPSGVLVALVDGGDDAFEDVFGQRVDPDGDRVLVSAPGDESWYLYDAPSGDLLADLSSRWYGSARLDDDRILAAKGGPFPTPTMASLFDAATGQKLFDLDAPGGSVRGFDLDAGRAVVGVPDASGGEGLAYRFDTTTGAPLGTLAASVGEVGSDFGEQVSVREGYALVGAPLADGGRGAVHVFDLATGAELHVLTASDAAPGARFGSTIDLDGGRALIAAASAGKAYVFDALQGVELSILQPQDGAPYFGFGNDAALDWGEGRRTAAVGAFGSGTLMYVFDAATGVQVGKTEVVITDLFGYPIAADLAADDGRLFLGFGTSDFVVLDGESQVVNVYEDPIGLGPLTFCVPKASSDGCLAQVGASGPGALPVSGANDWTVTATDVRAQRAGLAFASLGPPAFLPFVGGTLCATPPLERGPVTFSGGTTGCTGSFSTVINTGDVLPYGLDGGPGTSVIYQWWYRDPANGAGNLGTALSNAVEVLFQ